MTFANYFGYDSRLTTNTQRQTHCNAFVSCQTVPQAGLSSGSLEVPLSANSFVVMRYIIVSALVEKKMAVLTVINDWQPVEMTFVPEHVPSRKNKTLSKRVKPFKNIMHRECQSISS